jgi:hypothetical protein
MVVEHVFRKTPRHFSVENIVNNPGVPLVVPRPLADIHESGCCRTAKQAVFQVDHPEPY